MTKDDKLDEILTEFSDGLDFVLEVNDMPPQDKYFFDRPYKEAKAKLTQLNTEARIDELKHLEGGTDYWLDNGEVTTVSDRIAELKGNHDNQ